MYKEICEEMKKRAKTWIDSRCATSDEVRICWLIREIERLQKMGHTMFAAYNLDGVPCGPLAESLDVGEFMLVTGAKRAGLDVDIDILKRAGYSIKKVKVIPIEEQTTSEEAKHLGGDLDEKKIEVIKQNSTCEVPGCSEEAYYSGYYRVLDPFGAQTGLIQLRCVCKEHKSVLIGGQK